MGGRPRELELTHDALIERYQGATYTMPLREVESIRFLVGTKQNHSWHDEISFIRGLLVITVSSTQAHPGGVRESRAHYRKFVRLALKRIEEAGGAPRIPYGGYPGWLGTTLFSSSVLTLLVPFVAASPSDPSLLVCMVPAAVLALLGWMVWRNPQQSLTIAEAREMAVPEKGAD
jgi:hypothetical protein